MYPKEKAKELIEKYLVIQEVGLGNTEEELAEYQERKAKEYVMICIDEIIHSETVLIENLLLKQSKRIAQSGLQYWVEVKEEIEVYFN